MLSEVLMKAIDPVCKMEVDTDSAQWTFQYQGKTYYFCAPGCMGSFEKNPEKFLSGEDGHAEGHGGHPAH